MSRKLTFMIVPAALMMAMPAVGADKQAPVELSAAELAALQSKTYDVPFKVMFPATISTLQSLGYLNINASRDAGTISAETEAKGKIIYNIIWGFGKKKRTQLASLFVEEIGSSRSTVKLNLTINEAKSRGFNNAFTDGTLVRQADPYKDFFASLDTEVQRRIELERAEGPAQPGS